MGSRSPDLWRKQDNLKKKLQYFMGEGIVQSRENTKESKKNYAQMEVAECEKKIKKLKKVRRQRMKTL